MPDFDIDFCMDGRDRVIEYVAQKYGRQSVSQIITFGSMAAKAVVRDVGRALGHPYGFVDSIAKLIPMDLGMTLSKALEDEPQLKARYLEDEEVKALIDMALKLEGTVRNAGKHAGGVVISPSLLTDFSPVYCEEGSQQLVTQFDKDDVEAAGLVKFDFLGLRNLTIIAAAVETVNALRKQQNLEPVDIDLIPLDDKPSFDLLKRCETTAVFQLESRGMKDLIRRLQPDCFEDIIALVALFRPGPLQSGMVDDFINRKHGRAVVEYPHPLTAEVLKATYGIILYQEQVMLIPQVLAGYTLGGADLLRRAMGKKKPEEMAKQREVFMEGAVKNNIPADTAGHIFDLMEKFAGYGFNKSHSAAYALVAYQTAWLKAHYPAAFMAAVLSSDMDNTDKVVNFIEECQAMKLKIAAPNVNHSQFRFTVLNDKTILFGLGAVKGVGENAIDCIIAARKEGEFTSLFDLCRRVDLRKANRRVLEALIAAGALDTLGANRESMLASLDKALQLAEQHGQSVESGQHDLFALHSSPAESDAYIEVPMTSLYDRLLREKEVLGFYLSAHPIDVYQDELQKLKCKRLNEVKPTARNMITLLAGIIVSIRKIKTKRGSIMLIVTLEDRSGRFEVTVFSELAEKYQALLQVDRLLIAEAEVSPDEFSGGIRSTAKELMNLETARQKQVRALNITLTHDQAEKGVLLQLQQVLQNYSGNCPLEITYEAPEAIAKFRCGDGYRVAVSDACLTALQKLIPAQQVELRYN
jgi:DNA polymerase-3 subunit alpha